MNLATPSDVTEGTSLTISNRESKRVSRIEKFENLPATVSKAGLPPKSPGQDMNIVGSKINTDNNNKVTISIQKSNRKSETASFMTKKKVSPPVNFSKLIQKQRHFYKSILNNKYSH
jgi:hypothetical protein